MKPGLPSSSAEWEFYDSLWQDRAWMVRRVDRVSVIDRNRVQLNITFTIDNSAILQSIEETGLSTLYSSKGDSEVFQVPLPLFQWERAPILDVDVRDGNGQRLAIATGDTNTRMAECIVLHKAFGSDSLLDNLEKNPLFARFYFDLFYVLRTGSYRKYEVLVSYVDEISKSYVNGVLTESQENELDYFQFWNHFFQKTDLYTLITLMQSHIFVTYVEVNPTVDFQVISCRLVYDNKFDVGKLQFGRAVYPNDIRSTGFNGVDRHVHVRVEAPHGMRIAYLELSDIQDGSLVPRNKLRYKTTPEFVELVRKRENGSDETGMALTLYYTPKRSTFVSPATFLSFIYCIMLAVALFSNPDQTDINTVAILTAVPAIAAAFLTKDITHDLASHVCERSRWIFAYVSAAVFLSSTILITLSGTSFSWLAYVIGTVALLASGVFLMSNSWSLIRMRRYIKAGCTIRDK